jgi:hypothetical protein
MPLTVFSFPVVREEVPAVSGSLFPILPGLLLPLGSMVFLWRYIQIRTMPYVMDPTPYHLMMLNRF